MVCLDHIFAVSCVQDSALYPGDVAIATKVCFDSCVQVPLQLVIRETSDAGTPIVAHQPGSPSALAYQHISSLIFTKLQQTPTQLQPPLLGRSPGVR